jgi:hypothetical protein
MSVNYKISGTTLIIETEYADFGTFMEETRDPVYRTILEAFKELLKKDRVNVIVQASVDNAEFESDLEFTRNSINLLDEIVIPYFESIEDYETCNEVLKLQKKLVRK